MKLMKAYQFTLWKWFTGCAVLMIWLSITLGFAFGGTFQDSFLYPGGLHGYNTSRWICSQIGAPGLILTLLVSLVLIAIFFTRETMQVVRKAFHPAFPTREKEVPDTPVAEPAGQSLAKEVPPCPVSPTSDKSQDDPEHHPVEIELKPVIEKDAPITPAYIPETSEQPKEQVITDSQPVPGKA